MKWIMFDWERTEMFQNGHRVYFQGPDALFRAVRVGEVISGRLYPCLCPDFSQDRETSPHPDYEEAAVEVVSLELVERGHIRMGVEKA